MNNQLMPTIPGQICKIVSDVADMEEREVYIVTEDPTEFEDEDDIIVVSLTSLQRNQSNPDQAERMPVRKDRLVVVANDLAGYVNSWNIK